MTPVAPQTACLFQIKTYLPNNLMQAALSQAESLRDSACDSGTPAELFWGLRASILVVIYGKYMRGVGSASCALWRCFQSLALITLTAKCNAQLFFGVLHSVGIVVLTHVHSFVSRANSSCTRQMSRSCLIRQLPAPPHLRIQRQLHTHHAPR